MFSKWKNERPFWGALLTLLSGILVLWVPLNLYLSTFLPGTVAIVGLIFGGMIIIIGLLSFIFAQFSKVFGIMTMFLSILSVIGALGGFLVGTIIGIIGGALCIAWNLEENNIERIQTNNDKGAILPAPFNDSSHTM